VVNLAGSYITQKPRALRCRAKKAASTSHHAKTVGVKFWVNIRESGLKRRSAQSTIDIRQGEGISHV
jgi:hypothetical protein